MHLFLDDGNQAEVQVEHSCLEDAHYFLDKLDGKEHTLLCIMASEMLSLMVGGGADLFVVTKTLPGDQNLTLKNPAFGNSVSKLDEKIYLCAGGQVGDFSQSIVVNKTTAQKALQDFFMGNTSTLKWRTEP